MTTQELREHYAGLAMQSLMDALFSDEAMCAALLKEQGNDLQAVVKRLAESAFAFADAMVKEAHSD